MKISYLVGERTKENPADINIRSHALMVRGGFMKQVGNGIFTLTAPAKRITQKIERIIREEMDAIDGQEVLFPVVMPAELWMESGRFESIGDELVRFKDRGDRDMVLGMTHEEAAVHLARNTVSSYNQMPFMIYQIQTKFRDEPRARGGLIRVREFTMKDAYSFHTSQEDLEAYYQRVYDAYIRIFKRIGMKDFIAVKSDSGMMGGSVAHEYMLLTEIGEDTIAICPSCDYCANMEVAEGGRPAVDYGTEEELKEVFTGDAHDIDEVCKALGVTADHTMKAVCYAVKGNADRGVIVFIRGDLEVNEAKLKKIIKADIVPNDLKDSTELFAGNIGAVGLSVKNTEIIFDASLKGAYNLVCGANKPEFHLTGVSVARDLPNVTFADVAKVRAGDTCPKCGAPLTLRNGIEIGNIFQLGTKYTKSMDMTILDRDGKSMNPIMGCYGIGVGRAMAPVAEESNDDRGIIWPMSIAPWHVFLAALRPDDVNVRAVADSVYQELQAAGVEVLYDDRDVSPGFKFADSDLIGCPIRVVISPRNLANGEAELVMRDGSLKEFVKMEDLKARILELIATKTAELNK